MTVRGLIAAIRFLTRLPLPATAASTGGDLAEAAPWVPLVGGVVGLLVALSAAAAGTAGVWPAALAGLVAWVVVTGALHLDGLSDVADGLGAAHRSQKPNIERFVEVARDPHIGSFGVVAIVTQMLAKLVLMATLAPALSIGAIALVAAWARWGSLLLARIVPSLGAGMGQRFADGIDGRTVALWAVLLVVASIVVAPVLVLAPAASTALAFYWRRRLGGMTGDCHGASIEITETVLLALLVAVHV